MKNAIQINNAVLTISLNRRPHMKIKKSQSSFLAWLYRARTLFAHAQCPEICDSNQNTAVGDFALGSDMTGVSNTAIGESALAKNNTYHNTAIGFEALAANTVWQH